VVKKGWSPPEDLIFSSRFKLEKTGNGLKITEPWFVRMLLVLAILFVPFSQIVPFLSIFTSENNLSLLVCLAIPLGGLGLMASYIMLAACLSKTIVTVSPEKIEIVAGPLPWLGVRTQQLKAGAIHQLKVVNRLFGQELQVLYGEQGRSLVLFRMLGRAMAFYLEEEISNYLGLPLPAEPVPLPTQYKKEDWTSIHNFAEFNQLHFRISRFAIAPTLSGLYQSCQLKISFFNWPNPKPFSLTRLRLSVLQRKVLSLSVLDQNHTPLQVAQILDTFVAMTTALDLSGIFQITSGGQRLLYEEPNLRTDPASLQALCELSAQLLRVYPRLSSLGGAAIPSLKPLATQSHPFQPVAIQLLRDIGRETQCRLGEQANQLFCPSCLRHCAVHEVKLTLMDRPIYYGCRSCGQSLEFLSAKKAVIAILDTQMTQKYILRDEVLYGNWLLHRQSFDFDEIYIRRASDEEVERFAVQVGNDTDPLQQPRYATMRCLVWPDSGLSENSLKILKRTFGRVEIKGQSK
jgi:hypothetical protein